MKKLLSLSLAFIMLFAISFQAVAADDNILDGSTTNGLTYSLSSDYVLTISGTGAMDSYSSFGTNISPWKDYIDNIVEVVIEEGVTSVGSYAFYGSDSLVKVTLPSTISSIAANSFGYCKALEEITIPDLVTSLSSSTFNYCTSLKIVNIGSGLTSFNSWAFTGSTAIEAMNVSEDNIYLASIDGVLFNAAMTQITLYPAGKTDAEYTVPDSVTSIATSAFEGNTYLEAIYVPNTLVTIGSFAFYGCSSLTTLGLSDALTSIGGNAFYGTNITSLYFGASFSDFDTNIIGNQALTLENIYVSEDNETYSSIDGVLFNKDGTELLLYCSGRTATSYTIPDGVTTVGSHAFDSNSYLETLEVPASVTSFSSTTIDDCVNLTSVYVHEGSVALEIDTTYKSYTVEVTSYCVDADGDEACDICGGYVKALTCWEKIVEFFTNAFNDFVAFFEDLFGIS